MWDYHCKILQNYHCHDLSLGRALLPFEACPFATTSELPKLRNTGCAPIQLVDSLGSNQHNSSELIECTPRFLNQSHFEQVTTVVANG